MIRVKKGGWNKEAALLGIFWYYSKGMYIKATILLIICLLTAGIGIIPIWIYCGYKGNEDYYKFVKDNYENI